MKHLASALTSLLIATVANTTPERVETGDSELLDRIIAYSVANLHDPHLCAASVARRHGISKRHLYRLFQERDQSFAAWVRHERLNRIHRDLSDPALRHRSAAVIAAAWGMHDPAHLARSLKKLFGCTAADLRRAISRPAHPSPNPMP